MSDLYIDYQMLKRVRESLQNIRDLLQTPADQMDKVSAKAMGVTELERKMDQFGEEWGYGIDQLKKGSEGAAKTLKKIENGFEGFDGDLAKALRKANKE